MEVTAYYEQGVRFGVRVRGHHLVCDQPEAGGGEDAGPTPPEFLLASLATCAGYYAAEYLRTRSLPAAGLEVSVHAEKATNPGRLSRFTIDVHTGTPLEERHRDSVLRAVKRCLIHNTLLQAPQIDISLNQQALPLAS
jgi:uncharacterized OsmC-like protein